jgi:hypothetical protein
LRSWCDKKIHFPQSGPFQSEQGESGLLVSPNICDDNQGFAKYLCKKPPEIRDDKRYLTLSTAELLLNICENHKL